LLENLLLASATQGLSHDDDIVVDRILPLAEVERLLDLSHSTFHRAVRPTLPVIRLSARRLGVRASDLRRWQAARLQAPAQAD
jgi:predicted DNA-binding transcriptional regulator AlpA